ncbi:MAG: ASCH domain-containing protein [Erysipelotrichaceae bacterium]|nr:ASCH domain-containing protein [Erysipelotrichaceae bacterium]
MKVITLKQPWASLVAEGIKIWEFRSWKYNYRGEILIHAGAGVDKEAMKKVELLNLEYPQKKIIAKVTIEDCLELNDDLNKEICFSNPMVYGNKNRSGFVWKLKDAKKIDIDNTISGKQGIWNYDLDE